MLILTLETSTLTTINIELLETYHKEHYYEQNVLKKIITYYIEVSHEYDKAIAKITDGIVIKSKGIQSAQLHAMEIPEAW